ncbi:MAG: hypothetical protein IKE65_00645 [Clostridia bacterium]|nr:hypothetical protein [Clostridia bacterium]
MLFQKEKMKEESQKHHAAIEAYLSEFYCPDPFPAAPCAAPSMADGFGEAAALRRKKEPVCSESSFRFDRVPQKNTSRESAREEDEYVFEESEAAPLTESEAQSLDEYLHQVRDESFSEMLLRIIDEKQMKDADCYKKAHIDKRLFSKIRSNSMYKPSKQTALALALALELPYEQACEMLKKAGYAFSPANKGDLIVEYYIKHGIYNILLINTSLFEFDQPLIGSY